MDGDLHAVVSVRLFTDRKCFGPGIAELLRRVEERGSLRAAAQAMGMAYSKAWTITRNTEEALGFKLLATSTGGRNGGGAMLTADALRMLDTYERYCRRLRAAGEELLREEFGSFPERPDGGGSAGDRLSKDESAKDESAGDESDGDGSAGDGCAGDCPAGDERAVGPLPFGRSD